MNGQPHIHSLAIYDHQAFDGTVLIVYGDQQVYAPVRFGFLSRLVARLQYGTTDPGEIVEIVTRDLVRRHDEASRKAAVRATLFNAVGERMRALAPADRERWGSEQL